MLDPGASAPGRRDFSSCRSKGDDEYDYDGVASFRSVGSQSSSSFATWHCVDIPYDQRALRVFHVRDLLEKQSKQFLPLNKNLNIISDVKSISNWSREGDLFVARVVLHFPHSLYRFDRGTLDGDEVLPASSTVRSSLTRRGTQMANLFVAQKIPDEFEVRSVIDRFSVDISVKCSVSPCFKVKALVNPLTMHKLSPEVVIPLTIVEEHVVSLSTKEHVAEFVDNLVGMQNLTVENPMSLEQQMCDGSTYRVYLSPGLTLHGRLSNRGHIRKRYWDVGLERIKFWLTESRHGRRQLRAEYAPDDYAEDETFASKEQLLERFQRDGIVWVVLRKGVSYAEVCHRGLHVTDFISHNWAEPSREFLKTLRAARVKAAWVCTFAVCQHNVPNLSEDWMRSPFYLALASLTQTGRVVMMLDDQATVLTRIWPIFEVWVTTKLKLHFQMFLPTGELDFYADTPAARMARHKIENLDLEAAESSVEADKRMILSVISSDGEVVLWQVKRTLSVSALLFLLVLVSETSNFVFATPWIFGLVESWLHNYMHSSYAKPYAIMVHIALGSWNLRQWYWILSGADLCSTLRGLITTLSLGSGFVWWLGLTSLLDIANVVAIYIHGPSLLAENHAIKWLLCAQKTTTMWALTTVYVLQKTLPWALAHCADKLGYAHVNIREFEPAMPRVGFWITVTSCCLLEWTQLTQDSTESSPLCYEDDVSKQFVHFALQEPTWLHHTILIGLCAWSVSVTWSVALHVFDFAVLGPRWRLWLSVVLVILSISAVLARLIVKDQLWRLLDEHWYHLELGVLVWATASTFWNRHYLRRVCASWLPKSVVKSNEVDVEKSTEVQMSFLTPRRHLNHDESAML